MFTVSRKSRYFKENDLKTFDFLKDSVRVVCSFVSNQEVAMSLLSLVGGYFSIALVFVVLVVNKKINDGKKEELNARFFILAFLFGPLIAIPILVLSLFFWPSKDPVQLLYSKLSLSEGKSAEYILSEITADGETIGWGGVLKAEALLDDMVIEGSARDEEIYDEESGEAVTLYYKGSSPYEEKEEKGFSWLPGFRPAT